VAEPQHKLGFFARFIKPSPASDPCHIQRGSYLGLTPKTNVTALLPRKIAFTLAEVLITLGIIGVVAAMTIPGVIKNYEKQVTISKLKKVYSCLNQMISRSYADNGPVTSFLKSGETLTATSTEQFFKTYVLTYFDEPKVANNRFYKTTNDYVYKRIDNRTYQESIFTNYGAGRILFKTKDGVIYYMTNLQWDNSSGKQVATNSSEIKILVDINGINEPNMLGKDVFKFSISLNSNKVVPACYNKSEAYINSDCNSNGGSGGCCADRIMRAGWEIKGNYPW
jgi:type II secretory pathway pseudopilin PulG